MLAIIHLSDSENNMVFAKLKYLGHYSDMHAKVFSCLEKEFEEIEEGLQGDSYVWVFQGNDKVAVDTFTAMQHEVKCSNKDSSLVGQVIEALKKEFVVVTYEHPELEPHE